MGSDGKGNTTHGLIEQNLRRVYGAVLEESIPDRFNLLLERLKAAEASERKDGK